MSKNKSYKKKKMKKPVNYKKLGIIAGVILAIALFVVIFINATKEEYYECTEYSWYEKVDSNEYNYEINQKEIYEFYRIFLEDDGTFPSLPVYTSKILVKLCTYIFTKNHIKTPIFA